MKSIYEIKRFTSSNDLYYLRLVKIYLNNIDPAFRTNTSEITYWLDNYESKFMDRFFLFGFYLNNVLVGFSELAYFVDSKILVVDYLVIARQFRKNNTFYEFFEKIKEYFETVEILIDYAIAEVGFVNEKNEPGENTRALIRLLKMSGFGVLKCEYYQPRLGIDNFESETKSILMLYLPREAHRIKKETFLSILKTIYFKHYQRWYEKFLDENSMIGYNQMLFTFFTKIESELAKKSYVEVNGYKNLFSEETSLPEQVRNKKGIKILVSVVLFIISSITVGVAFLFIKKRYGLDFSTQSTIAVVAFIIVLFTLSIIYEGKANIFTKLLEKLIDKFTG